MGAMLPSAILFVSEEGADRLLCDLDEVDEVRPLSDKEIGGRWTRPYSDGLNGNSGSSTNHEGDTLSILSMSGVSMSMVGGVDDSVEFRCPRK